MFIGHYAAALAIRTDERSPSLASLFVAVQWVDFVFWSLVLVGIEKLRIIPGFTETTPFDLYYMPYSHSVLAFVLWSLAAVGFSRFVLRTSWRGGVLLGAAVFSHFLLDLPVHRSDLPLATDDTFKLGFGLWDHRLMAIVLEVLVFAGGVVWYARRRRETLSAGRWACFGVMLIAALVFPFAPLPESLVQVALMSLASYLALAGAAAWLERAEKPA